MKYNKRLKDLLCSILIMGLSLVVSLRLSLIFEDNNLFAAPVFILAIALISRFTDGYIYGIISSVVGVFCVNIIFTYPFWEFNLTISGYPLTFAVMLFVSLIISTLTSRIKMQEKLKFEAAKEKMRANLLRSISHDIRTPLASIMGASSTLLENDGLPTAERDDLLREINKDAQWLVRVTENLLSVTKFSGDNVMLKKSDEVVEEIVSSAIVKFRKNQASIPITVSKPSEILLVPMDAVLIEQVLINLLENVVAHGEKATHIWVTIECRNGQVIFRVADDGVGISASRRAHIFEGCELQEGPKTQDGKRNMGIGLSVCSSIISAHGGKMTAENNEYGGATFSFWLPYEENCNEHCITG